MFNAVQKYCRQLIHRNFLQFYCAALGKHMSEITRYVYFFLLSFQWFNCIIFSIGSE